jgi:drug/metabolite transporter (DMT)-like permease
MVPCIASARAFCSTRLVKPLHLALLIVMNCLWAAAYSMFKALQDHLDSGQLTTLRFGLAAAVLACCWPWFAGAAPRGRDLLRSILMGVIVFVVAPRLQVAGVQEGQATDASVLMALDPLIASVGAAFFLKEHIGPRRWVGFGLGMVGVVAMAEVWRPEFRLPGLVTNALILLSFFCETTYSLIGKPIFPRASPFKILTVAIVAGALVNLALDGGSTWHAAAGLPPHAWGMLAYLTLICTVLGYALWFFVIKESEVNVAALTVFMQPVVGVIIAMAWLNENLRWGQLWGSLIIVAGLVIGLSRQLRRVPAA